MVDGEMLSQFIFSTIGALAGYALGLAYFSALRRSVERLASDAPALGPTLAGSGLRIAAAVGLFVILMRWSPVAAVAGLGGFAVARHRMLAKARGA